MTTIVRKLNGCDITIAYELCSRPGPRRFPDEPWEFEVSSVTFLGVDVWPIMEAEAREKIEAMCYTHIIEDRASTEIERALEREEDRRIFGN